MTGRKKKILIAKPGLDGHDVGAKVVVRALMDAGYEVIYTGLRQTPEAIAGKARDENVDVIGLSILSGSHLPLCQKTAKLLRDYQMTDRVWLVGGNIPEKDRHALAEMGFKGVFPTASKLSDIVSYIRENLP
ncbi:MAG: cobalamin B12-binding domain-containing protein [Sphingomonadales bacterium]|nr:cobalamin B12-binding domain-containing protein [Sphingomonadales bacterium]